MKHILALLLVLATGSAFGADYVPYYVWSEKDQSVEVDKTVVDSAGRPVKAPDGDPLTTKMIETKPGRVMLVVKQSFLGIDYLNPDDGRLVPEAYRKYWATARSGDAIPLPLGWQDWPALDRKDCSSVRDNGVFLVSPKKTDKSAWIVIQVEPTTFRSITK